MHTHVISVVFFLSRCSVFKRVVSSCDVTRAWAVGSLTLLFLQSVNWSSGLMFLSAPSLLLAYLFASLNTAQGLLITILHCTLARKVSAVSHATCLSRDQHIVLHAAFKRCIQGQKDYGRCLRLSQCCATTSSNSPDSVKGAALRSNSRYTSSQSRRATANRQVTNCHVCVHPLIPAEPGLTVCLCCRVASGGCGTTPCADRQSHLSSRRT